MSTSHFQDKDALEHVLEKRKEGILSTAEAHGVEMSSTASAFLDALKETALAFLLVWLLFSALSLSFFKELSLLIAFAFGWVIWRGGKVALMAWGHLERLHRLIEQEKFEIEHHRPQEREELNALYKAKGFQGKLLDEVVDVLMADPDRLLKVMLEEEMGLALEIYEHPLKQSLGAISGALGAALFSIAAFLLLPSFGIVISSFLLLIIGAVATAHLEKNRLISATIWTVSLGILASLGCYFLLKTILSFF